MLKVASSSILSAIKNYLEIPDGPTFPIVKEGYADPSGIPTSGQGLHTAPFPRTETPLKGYKNLAVVRHPLARLYSLYMEKVFNASNKYPGGIDRTAFPENKYPKMFIRNQHFDNFIDKVEYALMHPKKFGPNLHLETQSSQIPEGVKALKVEEVGPLLEIIVPKGNQSNSPFWQLAYSEVGQKKTRILYADDLERFGYR